MSITVCITLIESIQINTLSIRSSRHNCTSSNAELIAHASAIKIEASLGKLIITAVSLCGIQTADPTLAAAGFLDPSVYTCTVLFGFYFYLSHTSRTMSLSIVCYCVAVCCTQYLLVLPLVSQKTVTGILHIY